MNKLSPLLIADEGSIITMISVTTSDPEYVLENLQTHQQASSVIAWEEIRKQARSEVESEGATLKQI